MNVYSLGHVPYDLNRTLVHFKADHSKTVHNAMKDYAVTMYTYMEGKSS